MLKKQFDEQYEIRIARQNLNLVDIVRSANATVEGYRELREFYFDRTFTEIDRELKKKPSNYFDMTDKEQADRSNMLLSSILGGIS